MSKLLTIGILSQKKDLDVWLYRGEEWEYGTVASPSGRVWMDRNLGATRVATTYNDSQAYGDLFAWGRADDGHQARNATVLTSFAPNPFPDNDITYRRQSIPYNWWDHTGSHSSIMDDLWQGVDSINLPAPSGWRIPTINEWLTELSYFTTSIYGGYGSVLKLTAGGSRHTWFGDLRNVGTWGQYMSQSIGVPFTGTHPGPTFIRFDLTTTTTYETTTYRHGGYSVRLILN